MALADEVHNLGVKQYAASVDRKALLEKLLILIEPLVFKAAGSIGAVVLLGGDHLLEQVSAHTRDISARFIDITLSINVPIAI